MAARYCEKATRRGGDPMSGPAPAVCVELVIPKTRV